MQFIISEPNSEKSLARLTAPNGAHCVEMESTWDGFTRTVNPMEALRLLTIAISDGLRIEAYP